tara:strand:+ start:163 stop:1035 length:873 start_codon:yes stop_codon:yes gene_type:complete
MKEVKIVLDSDSMGDVLSWIPYVDKFQKITNSKVNVLSPFSELFNYPNLHFVTTNTNLFNSVKYNPDYRIGCIGENINLVDIPLQKIASDVLELEFEELRPKLNIPNVSRNVLGKYVTISCQSTAQFKYWNNFDGWQGVVDFLKNEGYNVVCIDQNRYFGDVKTIENTIPNGVIDKTSSNLSLFDRMVDIKYADFHIGLASGLSWLAWAVGTHVHVISGFSTTEELFKNKITKSLPPSQDICQGCWNNPQFVFDKKDWMYCPEHKSTPRVFECSRSISTEQVINDIRKLM